MRAKYGNTKTVYDGFKFDSKKEAAYAQQLDWRVKARDIKSYEKQVVFHLVVDGKKVCKYISDFIITHNDGSKEVVDCKGVKTAVFMLKWKLCQILYPNYKYSIV